VLFAALFNSRSEKLMRRMDEQLMETIPWVARMEHHREEHPPDRSHERPHSRNPLMNM